jgi:hypothetical protein
MTCAVAATAIGNPDIDRPDTNWAAKPVRDPPRAADFHNTYKSSWLLTPFSLPVLWLPAIEGWRGGGVEGYARSESLRA